MGKTKLVTPLVMLLVISLVVPASAGILYTVKSGVQSLAGGSSNQQPYIDANDRTLVPVRFVSEALGAEVDWIEQPRRTYCADTYRLLGCLKHVVGGIFTPQMCCHSTCHVVF